MSKKYAKDYDCTDCSEKAEVFFPVAEPDIPSYPYCRSCAGKRKIKLMNKLTKL